MNVLRPVARYYGGKFTLAPWIIGHINSIPHTTYVEVYGGAASVLMRKDPSRLDVYNDIDKEMINLFQVLRSKSLATRLRKQLFLTPFSRTEFISARRPSSSPVEQARRTLVKAWMGIGSVGIFRHTGFRGKMIHSHTTAVQDWAGYVDHVPSFVERLRGVVIENLPALDLIAKYDEPETLFYVDPPYLPDTRDRRHRDSYRHDMTEADHIKLSLAIHGIRGKALLSGYPSELYKSLYPDWVYMDKEHRADRSKVTVERLWFSPNAQPARLL